MKDVRYRQNIAAAMLLSVAMIAFLGACKGKAVEEAKSVVPAEIVSLETLKPVLGEAKDDVSGVLDVTQNEGEVVLNYRYYDADLQNIDNDMVTELAPKIQALYKDFGSLDRVVFRISINSAIPGEWKLYSGFALTRKIVGELQWSGILAEDFLRAALEHQRY
ncbi:MAG: hypothetical protein NT147_05990 [Candidatus Aminicenantes bacterium]|nr:hypothetical protein [Candidatus Aminicenantes bacterium]